MARVSKDEHLVAGQRQGHEVRQGSGDQEEGKDEGCVGKDEG